MPALIPGVNAQNNQSARQYRKQLLCRVFVTICIKDIGSCQLLRQELPTIEAIFKSMSVVFNTGLLSFSVNLQCHN